MTRISNRISYTTNREPIRMIRIGSLLLPKEAVVFACFILRLGYGESKPALTYGIEIISCRRLCRYVDRTVKHLDRIVTAALDERIT